MRLALYAGFASVDGARDDKPFVFVADMLAAPTQADCDPATCPGRECPIKKSAPCWSPVDIAGPRANANVRAITAAVFDLDHLKPGDLDGVRDRVAEYSYAGHSTHSHAPGDECYRLVLELSRPVLPAEWPLVRRVLVDVLELPADPQTGDLSRLYALPTPRKGIPLVTFRNQGTPVDVDEALTIARGAAAPTPAPRAPVSYDLGALRETLAAVRRSKASSSDPKRKSQADVLGQILEGRPLAKVGERDATILKACGLLAYWLPVGTPWEVAREILRPTLSAMLAAEPDERGLEYMFGVAERKWTRQVASRAAADAADAAARERMRASVAAANAASDAVDWTSLLIKGKDGPKACEANAVTLLTHAPELRGTITWNDVTRAIEVHGGPLAQVSAAALDTAAAAHLQLHHQFFGGSALVGRALLQVARTNPRDPIAEYLGELAWDGTHRIDDFLISRCGAATKNDSGEDITEHVRRISRRWLIGLVARGLQPGCQLDTVLILEGPQGIKKTSMLRALGGTWYVDTELNLEDKDAKLLVSSAWIVELGEVTSLLKGRHKAFITATIDKFRPPYGRIVESFPRRCVLVGTCNPDDGGYLDDPTGLRRFWPVKVSRIDVDAVVRDRDQILAEAVAAFRAGERWWLTGAEASAAEEQAQERAQAPRYKELIWAWWRGLPADRGSKLSPLWRGSEFSTDDLARKALSLSADRVDARVRRDIGYAMRELGFNRAREHTGARAWRYVATSALLSQHMTAPGPSQSMSVPLPS